MENLKVIRTEIESDYLSVLIEDKKEKLSVWVDLTVYRNELQCEWNKYIFNLNFTSDINIRDYQSKPENFDLCTSLATEHLERLGHIKQDNKGNWTRVIEIL